MGVGVDESIGDSTEIFVWGGREPESVGSDGAAVGGMEGLGEVIAGVRTVGMMVSDGGGRGDSDVKPGVGGGGVESGGVEMG